MNLNFLKEYFTECYRRGQENRLEYKYFTVGRVIMSIVATVRRAFSCKSKVQSQFTNSRRKFKYKYRKLQRLKIT